MKNKMMIALALGLATVVTGCTEKPAKEKPASVKELTLAERVRANVSKASDKDVKALKEELTSSIEALALDNKSKREQIEAINKGDLNLDGQVSDEETAAMATDEGKSAIEAAVKALNDAIAQNDKNSEAQIAEARGLKDILAAREGLAGMGQVDADGNGEVSAEEQTAYDAKLAELTKAVTDAEAAYTTLVTVAKN